jgi:hypothetical protein
MEQILEEELETLNVYYLQRIAEEVVSSWMVVMGVSMPIVKMERLLDDHEVNSTYYYHSWWRDTRLKVESFDEKMNGNNCFLVGKQVVKMIGGDKLGFTFRMICYLATFKGKWHRSKFKI